MADSALNRYVMQGTSTQRASYTPAPATVAAGQPLGVFWFETDTGKLYAWNQTGTPAWQLVSGGGGGGGALSIRGSSSAGSQTTSTVINLPAGCVKGDLAVLFCAGGYAPPASIAGWTTVDREPSGATEIGCYSRVLSQADITAGNVTVTYSNTYDNVNAMIVLKGNALIRPMNQGSLVNTSPPNGTSASIGPTDGSPTANDLVVMWGAGRLSAGTLTNTTAWTGATTQQQVISAVSSPQLAAALSTLTPVGTGDLTETCTWSATVLPSLYIVCLHPAGTI